MSAILSADDLNDFISPGVACIKPVETIPEQTAQSESDLDPYEVTTEDKVRPEPNSTPAQISLTDCLACSGCVTSAEAVLVSLQSHKEVLDTLDKYAELHLPWKDAGHRVDASNHERIFIASVSPQARASLAATYNVSERQAGHMIQQLLSGPNGLRAGGVHNSGFTWVVDTNVMRQVCLVAAADEVQRTVDAVGSCGKCLVLTSACPGWICYVEKTHPHVIPHLSKLKSPQALTGVLLKSVLAKNFCVPPEKVWHLAVMPCFDKKLEASRAELSSHSWLGKDGAAVRDVDCVITARELLMLAESRGIVFPQLLRSPLPRSSVPPFPDTTLDNFLFGHNRGQKRKRTTTENAAIGTSGGYLHHVLKTQQLLHPLSEIRIRRGRNADVTEYAIVTPKGKDVFKAARYYGFRNIQNLVRRLKPPKVSRVTGGTVRRFNNVRESRAGLSNGEDSQYAYVEVMACPGGCTNGGGQVKASDLTTLRPHEDAGVQSCGTGEAIPQQQRDWLAKVDEAYWSAEEEVQFVKDSGGVSVEGLLDGAHSGDTDDGIVDGVDRRYVQEILQHWSSATGIDLNTLLLTTYSAVDSDVGKSNGNAVDMARVAGLAMTAGGGW